MRQLWCQSAVERYGIEVVKIPRKQNLADSLTHGITKKEQALFHEAVGIQIESLEPSSARLEGSSSRCAGSSIMSGIRACEEDRQYEAVSSSKAGKVIWGPWGEKGVIGVYGVSGVVGVSGVMDRLFPLPGTRGAATFSSPSIFRRWRGALAVS